MGPPTVSKSQEWIKKVDKINQRINQQNKLNLWNFSFQENRGPVGTNYSKVIPAKEINFRDRDSFWKKEEEEERRRVEVEKDRRQQEVVKVEKVSYIVSLLCRLLITIEYRKDEFEKKKNTTNENVKLQLMIWNHQQRTWPQ